MVFILNEEKAKKIFENYKNVAAFSLGASKGISIDGIDVSYEHLTFLPDNDTVNGIINGDLKLKKVIKKAVKALKKPKLDDVENISIGLGMAQLITIITDNRKSKRGPAVLVFVTDEENAERNKIMVKYLTALLEEFGIKPITSAKVVNKLFKKKGKKAVNKVLKFISEEKGCRLSGKGTELKRSLYIMYEMELRQSAMSGLDLSELDGNAAEMATKTMLKIYTGENLKSVSSKDMAKTLAKKDKAAVKSYNALRDILLSIDPAFKLPKVKYGYNKKKKVATKPKMDRKKFKKFFEKKKNRSFIMLVFGHTVATNLGLEIGSKEYNTHMKGICNQGAFRDAKEFATAATAYAKAVGAEG